MTSFWPGSEALRLWLFKNRISHAQFGERIGKSTATIDKYAQGGVPPTDVQSFIEKETNGDVSCSHWSEQLSNAVRIAEARALLSQVDAQMKRD